jgi:hypothetical protein
MNKEIKSFGLALLAFPIVFAILGLLERLGWIESGKPRSWAALKWVVLIVCGLAYFLGLFFV